MARLSAKERAKLPDSAFAYVDERGRRRLPIHDEPHVRNALARFDRIVFEDDAARERARTRLLRAAKRFGIVPVGFIAAQLRSGEGTPSEGDLPSGTVTFLLSDIEASTSHLDRLGDKYAGLLRAVRRIMRRIVTRAGGHEVDARADEYFAVFKKASDAVEAAVTIQRLIRGHSWPDGVPVRVRIGIHTGRPTLSDGGYIGLAVHTAARVCQAGHGGQTVVTEPTVRALRRSFPEGVNPRSLGRYELPGLTKPVALYQLEVKGLRSRFPALRYAQANAKRRAARASSTATPRTRPRPRPSRARTGRSR